jgi:deoxyribodipyrimidine photo-lyase
LYCFDSRFFKASAWGHVKTGSFRAQFLLESALELKQSLRALGSDLVVSCDSPEDVIEGLARGASSCSVMCTEEVTSEELAVDARVGQVWSMLWIGRVCVIHKG